mmetsp:Transcript_9585/g.27173  ORF Transcript_9585/g.27173 Transcript_9585/m.27173 type:complete len:385 (-) Transcript_9585:845-1999(-)
MAENAFMASTGTPVGMGLAADGRRAGRARRVDSCLATAREMALPTACSSSTHSVSNRSAASCVSEGAKVGACSGPGERKCPAALTPPWWSRTSLLFRSPTTAAQSAARVFCGVGSLASTGASGRSLASWGAWSRSKPDPSSDASRAPTDGRGEATPPPQSRWQRRSRPREAPVRSQTRASWDERSNRPRESRGWREALSAPLFLPFLLGGGASASSKSLSTRAYCDAGEPLAASWMAEALLGREKFSFPRLPRARSSSRSSSSSSTWMEIRRNDGEGGGVDGPPGSGSRRSGDGGALRVLRGTVGSAAAAAAAAAEALASDATRDSNSWSRCSATSSRSCFSTSLFPGALSAAVRASVMASSRRPRRRRAVLRRTRALTLTGSR